VGFHAPFRWFREFRDLGPRIFSGFFHAYSNQFSLVLSESASPGDSSRSSPSRPFVAKLFEFGLGVSASEIRHVVHLIGFAFEFTGFVEFAERTARVVFDTNTAPAINAPGPVSAGQPVLVPGVTLGVTGGGEFLPRRAFS